MIDMTKQGACPAPAGVVLPERVDASGFLDDPISHAEAEAWNTCLDAVAKLNGAPK